MTFGAVGTYKIYNKNKTKYDLRFIVYLILYTLLVLFIRSLFKDLGCKLKNNNSTIPWIFLITPTYSRPAQKPELVRISHVLHNIPNLLWILIEDSNKKTNLVSSFLKDNIQNYTHLNVETPKDFKQSSDDPKLSWKFPRGVLQRNLGLEWIKNCMSNIESAVIYFMDDDNTYDKNLFEEMRYTKKVSVWPVGLAGGMLVERPLVNLRTGRVEGWNAIWEKERTFPIDMAGFAFNIDLLRSHPRASFNLGSRRGYLETDFLTELGITMRDLEPKADLCRKIRVWHTKSWPPKLNQEEYLNSIGQRSDEGMAI